MEILESKLERFTSSEAKWSYEALVLRPWLDILSSEDGVPCEGVYDRGKGHVG